MKKYLRRMLAVTISMALITSSTLAAVAEDESNAVSISSEDSLTEVEVPATASGDELVPSVSIPDYSVTDDTKAIGGTEGSEIQEPPAELPSSDEESTTEQEPNTPAPEEEEETSSEAKPETPDGDSSNPDISEEDTMHQEPEIPDGDSSSSEIPDEDTMHQEPEIPDGDISNPDTSEEDTVPQEPETPNGDISNPDTSEEDTVPQEPENPDGDSSNPEIPEQGAPEGNPVLGDSSVDGEQNEGNPDEGLSGEGVVVVTAMTDEDIITKYGMTSPVYADENGNITYIPGESVEFFFPEVLRGNIVERIGKSAFNGNEVFGMVVIPASIMEIGDNAFADCPNLKCIILKDRYDTSDMTLGENWSGDAEVLFGLVDEEIAAEEELVPVMPDAVGMPEEQPLPDENGPGDASAEEGKGPEGETPEGSEGGLNQGTDEPKDETSESTDNSTELPTEDGASGGADNGTEPPTEEVEDGVSEGTESSTDSPTDAAEGGTSEGIDNGTDPPTGAAGSSGTEEVTEGPSEEVVANGDTPEVTCDVAESGEDSATG